MAKSGQLHRDKTPTQWSYKSADVLYHINTAEEASQHETELQMLECSEGPTLDTSQNCVGGVYLSSSSLISCKLIPW